jgi:hypothetical protein
MSMLVIEATEVRRQRLKHNPESWLHGIAVVMPLIMEVDDVGPRR